MTRHGKNSTASAVYSYHEKKKDKKQSDYGSKTLRLGKDSIKEFDCCCLTLQPCQNPVVTPEGYLYDKQALLENILHQKSEIARKLKEYEKQKTRDQREMSELAKAEQDSRKQKFLKEHKDIAEKRPDTGASGSISNVTEGRDKQLPSFWIPSLTPEADRRVQAPDTKVRCAMSGKPLKLKNLIDVDFTPIKDRDSKTSLIVKQERYQCAVTGDVLGNTVPAVVLRTSGKVVTKECYEKLIKPEMRDPINGKSLTEKDVVELQRGATGFSGAGVQLEAKKDGPAMMTY